MGNTLNILYSIRDWTGNQWRWRKTGEMLSRFRVVLITLSQLYSAPIEIVSISSVKQEHFFQICPISSFKSNVIQMTDSILKLKS
jgi:hypothetical protein